MAIALTVVAIFWAFARSLGLGHARDLFEGLFYITGIIAAVLSYAQYRDNSQQERARWTFDLYQRFYSDEKMRKIREELDWDRFAFLRDPEDPAHAEKLAELDKYLNFFEFMSHLIECRRIPETDAWGLFGHFLEDLKKATCTELHLQIRLSKAV